jgi:2-polyprenyl-3-methyl-5-hydroxy-6-metoxy-1,4-benzoquinol methylase
MKSLENPDLHHYYAGFEKQLERGEADRFCWMVGYLAGLARISKNSRVLDIGCGFGMESIALSYLTGCEVVANDLRSTMTQVLDQGIGNLARDGVNVRVGTYLGDICEAGFSSEFDALVCNQTIEHVLDLDRMFQTCIRALKPGGRLVITNDNNAHNPTMFQSAQEQWARRDRDQGYIDQLKQERPIENADIQPYAVMREQIIRKTNPALTDAQVKRLVDATAGMTQAQIIPLARADASSPLPTPPTLSWCRNPLTGEYCERLIDPFAIAGDLERAGFNAKILHGFRKPPLSFFNGVGLAPVNKMLFRIRPFFVIVGQKPAAG